MANLINPLPGIKKLSGQLNYQKWSLDVKSTTKLADTWDAIIGVSELLYSSAPSVQWESLTLASPTSNCQ